MVALTLLVLLFGGCDKNITIQDIGDSFQKNKSLFKVGVTGAVILTLQNHEELAPGIYDVASAMTKDTTEEYTTLNIALERVKKLIQARESYQRKPPAVKLVIMNLVETVGTEAGVYLRRRGVDAPEEIQVIVGEVAGWIAEAASYYIE